MLNKWIYSILICSFFSCAHAEVERRAAFDLGSGAIKLLVADVDTDTQCIVNYVYGQDIKVPAQNLIQNCFSDEIQQKLRVAMHELKAAADKQGAKKYFGAATEAFRKAQNGEELLTSIGHDEGMRILIIDQQEESELGFATAVEISKGDPNSAVVWDIGNGSSQISWKEGNRIYSYMKPLGKTPVKNSVLRLQGKVGNKSPNPISEKEANETRQLLEKELGVVPTGLVCKLADPTTVVYGVGAVHYGNIYTSSHQVNYTQKVVDKLLNERLEQPDSALNDDDPEFWVSDLIMVSAVMSHLNIKSVVTTKAINKAPVPTPGNTVGIVVTPQYWK